MANLFRNAFMVATLAVLVALGSWQLERLQWKEGKIAAYEKARSTPAEPFETLIANHKPQAIRYRQVTVSGNFLHEKELHLGGRRYYGNTGYHVLTPLELADGRHVLVNRGWVPSEYKQQEQRPTDSYPAGLTRQTGMIQLPKPPGIFTPENHPDKNFWFTVDIAAMEKETGLTLLPLVIKLVNPQRQRTDFPAPTDGKVVLRNDHLGYAITWYLLAVAAAIIFYLRFFRKKPDPA